MGELEVPPSVFALFLCSSLSLCCWPLSARGYWASTAWGKEYGSRGSHKVPLRSDLKDLSQKKDTDGKTEQCAPIWHSEVCKRSTLLKCQLCLRKRVPGKTTNRTGKGASFISVHASLWLPCCACYTLFAH